MTIEDLITRINNLPTHISHGNQIVKRTEVIKLIRKYEYYLALEKEIRLPKENENEN